MSFPFSTNVEHYSKNDICELLGIQPGASLTEAVLQSRKHHWQQRILQNSSLTETQKGGLQMFIENILQKLRTTNAFLQNIYNTDTSLHPTETLAGSHNVIPHPATPFAQSSPSEFYQGILNPLNRRILRQYLNIDTRFRENYHTSSASNFHVTLPLKFDKVVSLQLSAMEFPTTFYTISQVFGNNFFAISRSGGGSGGAAVIRIADGNYNYLTMCAAINSALAAAGYSDVTFSCNITSTAPNPPNPSGTGHTVVTVAGGSGGAVDLYFGGDPPLTAGDNFKGNNNNNNALNPLQLRLGWFLGFRYGLYENVDAELISEGVMDLAGPRYVYLVIDDFNNSVNDGFYGAFTNSILNKNILARITLFGTVFSVFKENNFQLVTTARQYFGPVNVYKLQIQLLDEYGRVLNLNNMDYSFCLQMQTVYDL